jgi:hypothetical protein
MVYQNNGCSEDWGKGLVRIGNATCECDQKAHISMDPKGTVDIHTKNEKATAYKDENEGTRMSVVSLDDTTVDHSFEAIDYNILSWIEILKTGNIHLISKQYRSYIDILGTNEQINIMGTDRVDIEGQTVINNTAATINENCGTHAITGFCSHGGCSCSSSDKRLKININTLPYGLSEVMNMMPISFNFKNNDYTNHLGFIAQDIQGVVPDVVQEQSDGMLGISYDELIPVLVNAIKELSQRVEHLEAKLLEHNT